MNAIQVPTSAGNLPGANDRENVSVLQSKCGILRNLLLKEASVIVCRLGPAWTI